MFRKYIPIICSIKLKTTIIIVIINIVGYVIVISDIVGVVTISNVARNSVQILTLLFACSRILFLMSSGISTSSLKIDLISFYISESHEDG